MRVWYLSLLIFVIWLPAFSQEEFIRVPVDKSTYEVSAIPINQFVVISCYKNFETNFMLIEKNNVLQERRIKVSAPKFYGAHENRNAVHVHLRGGTETGEKEFIITFFKDNSKPATVVFYEQQNETLFCYEYNGFHKVLFDKKSQLLKRETFFGSSPAFTKTIGNTDKDVLRFIKNKNSLTFIDSAGATFESLSSKHKVFQEQGIIYLLVDKDEDPKSPQLTKVTFDFENSFAGVHRKRLLIPPGMEHTSYLYHDHIYVFSNNSDFLSLSIFDRDSLTLKKNHVVMKSFDQMDLKGSGVFYSTEAKDDKYSNQFVDSGMKIVTKPV